MDDVQEVESALAAAGAAVVARLRAITPPDYWSEPARVAVDTKTKIRASGSVTTIAVTFDLPGSTVRVERSYGEKRERIATRTRG